MKEVSDQQSVEKKQFESRMKADYKLKKERWKREIADTDAPKRQKEAVLLQQVSHPIIRDYPAGYFSLHFLGFQTV